MSGNKVMQMDTTIDTNLASITPAFEDIPILDLAPFLDGSDTQGVAKKMGEICENIGFMYVKNHGVPQDLVEKMYRMSKAFFDLPIASKKQIDISLSGETLRGYIEPYAENVNPGITLDRKECLDLGLHATDNKPFFGANPYPKEIPEFQQTYEAYYTHMRRLARQLIQAIAMSLGLPIDYFETRQKNPITIQRLLHYPPQTGVISEQEMGAGAHTDYGFLTILSQDDKGGLQVQNRSGDWISAPPIKDAFIVNIGDFVQAFTNGKYISTLHRVINAGNQDRYSLPFFMDLDFDAVIETVPTCLNENGASDYAPYIGGQHKFKRFVESFAHLS